MDRVIEVNKDCKILKHTIVSNLAKSDVFDHAVQLRLTAFMKEGPFYQQGVMEVATEGND